MISSSNSSNTRQQQKRHVVLFPFMAKGHIIPLLQLSRLLLRREIAVTFLTTAANRPFVAASLAGTSAAVISLPFPLNIAGIPAGVESTDGLPSMSLLASFANATEAMKPHFEQTLESLLPRVSFMVTDGFLWWTQDSADKLNIPRLFYYGMPTYAMAVSRDVVVSRALLDVSDDKASVTVPSFPWIKVTPDDFDPIFLDPKLDPVHFEFVSKAVDSSTRSSGVIVNSFREIESVFVDYWSKNCAPYKAWCVGPLCLAEAESEAEPPRPHYLRWLDERLERGRSVLYVAFGSQAEISAEQIGEIARGLEESGVDFMWVVTRERVVLGGGDVAFEERVRERGVVVREWVDQGRVLRHESVRGFLSHCGWNSVAEGVMAAAVPVLAWPMVGDQCLNARMVAEEMKVGLRVAAEARRFVRWEELKERVKELMEGERGDDVRLNAGRVSAAAKKAVGEGGSSWVELESLIEDTCMNRTG